MCPLSRWSAIAAHLPKRTDNEIKNYWNTHLKKRLAKMGIDPVTHKLQKAILGSAIAGTTTMDPKNLSNLSHVAQWESARLQAEARLVKESKSRGGHQNDSIQLDHSDNPLDIDQFDDKFLRTSARPRCLDILRAWQTIVLPNLMRDGNGPNECDPSYNGLELSFGNGGSYFSENINAPEVSANMGFVGQYCDCHELSDLFEVLNDQGTTGSEAGYYGNNGWTHSNSYGNNNGDHDDDHEVNKHWNEVLKFLTF